MRSFIDQAADNLGRSMPPRLSIDANRFTLIDGSGNEKPIQQLFLDVVFVDLNPKVSKMYWGKEYNPNDAGGDIPVCWSDNGTAPSSQAATPQSAACFNCSHNVIGSAVSKFSGAKIKACVDMKKVAFVIPGDPQNMIFLMTIKPGSFGNWKTYINWLKGRPFERTVSGAGRCEPFDLVTRLTFESQGVIKFEPMPAPNGGPVLLADYPAVTEQIKAAWATNTTESIVGMDDVPHSGALAALAPVQQLAPPPSAQTLQAPPVGYGAPVQVQQPAPLFPTSTGTTMPATMAEQPKRTRRTKAQMAAEAGPAPTQAPFLPAQTNPQPAPAVATPPAATVPPMQGQAADPRQTDMLEIPAFLQRNPAPAQPAPAPTGQQFGLAQPAVPDAAMQDAIAKAFALPT